MTIFLSNQFAAQDPTPPANLLGQQLKDWLKANWYDPFHSSVGYTAARQQMYSYIDNESGTVYCVYTGFNQASAFTTFLDPINTEHTVPQSFYNSAEPMRSDIHHLFPTHESVNSARSNLQFDESPDQNTDNWYTGNSSGITSQTSIPNTNIDEYSELESGTFFEPKEDHKGDAARSIFYFYTMYPNQAGDISSIADINTLYQWHLDDPVSSKETIRNQKIQQTQGNYNPYVNNPNLIGLAWGFSNGNDACGCPISSSGFAQTNPTISISQSDLLKELKDISDLSIVRINNIYGSSEEMTLKELKAESKEIKLGSRLTIEDKTGLVHQTYIIASTDLN